MAATPCRHKPSARWSDKLGALFTIPIGAWRSWLRTLRRSLATSNSGICRPGEVEPETC